MLGQLFFFNIQNAKILYIAHNIYKLLIYSLIYYIFCDKILKHNVNFNLKKNYNVLYCQIFNSNKCLHSTEFNFKILNELSAMANSYFLKPVLDKTYMEHEVDRAFKYLESGQTLGKIVIKLKYVNSSNVF